ncbi:MAG TPA: aminotransferase class V-fold PLP-dependent enzyme, partial [Candidatus Brocadiia bacterium]|nr:aminotransferase class V-fold PLP-dependent enzyme [Candidatus Brocadiia bacterium]
PWVSGRETGGAGDPACRCRQALGRLFAVPDHRRVVLTQHATHALNLAILGLSLRPGDRVITSVTEHNSMLRPLYRLRKCSGVAVVVIGLDGQGLLDKAAFEAELRRGARLVALNHASNVTGQVNDIPWFFAKAKETGALTLLDASQTAGHLPVRPLDLGADLVAFTGHKGLLGPPGTGGLWVSPGLDLDQVLVGGTGVRSDLELHPPEMPTRLEAGTPNGPALAGLAVALEWLERNGQDHTRREQTLAADLRARLQRLTGLTLFGPKTPAPLTPVVSFRVHGRSVEETAYALLQGFDIVCRSGLHCAPLIHHAIGSSPGGTIRFSLSGFTTPQEVDAAVDAVERLRQ